MLAVAKEKEFNIPSLYKAIARLESYHEVTKVLVNLARQRRQFQGAPKFEEAWDKALKDVIKEEIRNES